MVVLGVDVHKDSHHVVGVDEAGRELVSWTSGTRTRDCEALIARAREAFGDDRVWAVEDCRHVSGRLERALLDAGESCERVPPKLMATAPRVIANDAASSALLRSEGAGRWVGVSARACMGGTPARARWCEQVQGAGQVRGSAARPPATPAARLLGPPHLDALAARGRRHFVAGGAGHGEAGLGLTARLHIGDARGAGQLGASRGRQGRGGEVGGGSGGQWGGGCGKHGLPLLSGLSGSLRGGKGRLNRPLAERSAAKGERRGRLAASPQCTSGCWGCRSARSRGSLQQGVAARLRCLTAGTRGRHTGRGGPSLCKGQMAESGARAPYRYPRCSHLAQLFLLAHVSQPAAPFVHLGWPPWACTPARTGEGWWMIGRSGGGRERRRSDAQDCRPGGGDVLRGPPRVMTSRHPPALFGRLCGAGCGRAGAARSCL